MSGVNQYLADYFGTTAPAEDELQKQAQAELFLKLAEEEGIEIDQLSDEQVAELYAATFGEEDDGGEQFSEVDEKVAAAELEWVQEKEAADKFAEAEFMGRTMAHAYVDELKKIAGRGVQYSGTEGELAEKIQREKVQRGNASSTKGRTPGAAGSGHSGGRKLRVGEGEGAGKGSWRTGASAPEGTSKGKGKRWKPMSERGRLDRLGSKVKGKVRQVGRDVRRLGATTGTGRALVRGAGKLQDFSKTRKGKAALIGAGLTAAGATGGGIYAATREKKATAAIDEYAVNWAFEKLAEVYDPDFVAERLQAAYVLDDGEGTKIAEAEDLEEAVDIRAGELAEAAGFPVEWDDDDEGADEEYIEE